MHGFMQHTTRLMSLVLVCLVSTSCASWPPQNQPTLCDDKGYCTLKKADNTGNTVANTIEAIILKGLIK